MCENKVRLTRKLNLQHAIVTHMVTPRETWPKEAIFTLLYSLTLDVHVTVCVVLVIRQLFFLFFGLLPFNIGEQNP
jgi:hypothetical protein